MESEIKVANWSCKKYQGVGNKLVEEYNIGQRKGGDKMFEAGQNGL